MIKNAYGYRLLGHPIYQAQSQEWQCAKVAVWTGCVKMMLWKLRVLVFNTSVHYNAVSKAKTWVRSRTADCNWWGCFDLPSAHIHLCHAQYITISHANDSALRSRWLMAPWHLRYCTRVIRSDCVRPALCVKDFTDACWSKACTAAPQARPWRHQEELRATEIDSETTPCLTCVLHRG